MKIRFSKPADTQAILGLGQKMMEESRFSDLTFNSEKTLKLIESMISRQPDTDCILLAVRDDGVLVGMLAGYVMGFFFCDGYVAQDRVYYVLPEYRGSSAAFKLILAFRRWAESKKVTELSINMSVAIDMERFDKFMKHLGFSCCGSNFAMRLSYKNVRLEN